MQVLSLGGVLSRSFRIFFRNFVPFVVLAAIAYVPILIWTAIFLQQDRITDEALLTYAIGSAVGGVILSMVATGAITFGVFEQLRGESASIGRCLSVGLARLLPVLGVSLVVGVVVALGMVALIVPGVILLCMLWLAVPITVVEEVGVIEAMKRSRALTDGLKGTIFGILFVIGIIENGIGMVLERSFLGGDAVSLDTFRTYIIAVTALAVVFTALRATANAVAYHDIRTAKEGVEIDELVSVFE